MSFRTLAIVIGLLVVSTATLVVGSPQKAPSSACEMKSAVLCAELPSSGFALQDALSPSDNNPSVWRRQVVYDFPFLVLYGLLLAGAGALRSTASPYRRLRATMIGSIALGSLMDAVENAGLLVAIGNVERSEPLSDGLAQFINIAAQSKFLLLCFGCALALSFFPLDKDPAASRRGRFQITLVACICGLALVGPFQVRFYEYALVGIVLTCLIFTIWIAANLLRRKSPDVATAPTA